ncbi:MAG: thiol peroxidase [Chloroflexi bacterium]|nr:thiol peroxidase [Chloroflexota bacterium]
MPQERTGAYKMRDNPLTLLGPEMKVGAKAPDFSVVGNDMKPITLDSSKGKARIIATVQSLDTGVCDQESKKWNELASQLPNVEILVVSKDLPFAQRRWCNSSGVQNIKTGSAYRDDSKFGEEYGVLVKETRFLARAVFVVDANGVVRHVQQVPDLLELPDFDAAAAAAKKASGR